MPPSPVDATSLVQAIAHQTLPAAPLEVGVAQHWLALDGVQPATAENTMARSVRGAPIRSSEAWEAGPTPGWAAVGPVRLMDGGGGVLAPADTGELGARDGTGEALLRLPLKHSLPDELQLYYSLVRRTLQHKGGVAPQVARGVMASLASDPGGLRELNQP